MADHKILIVEDEPLISYVIRKYLSQQGFKVSGIASRVNEAIELARTDRPDLILMDIFLNDKEDGIYAVEQIRKFSDVPVIYLSAFSDPETLERAKTTNPSGYLVKPIDERELLTNIPIAIHKYEADKKIKEIEQQLRKFSVVVEQSPVSILITDTNGNIEYANSKFSRVSGYTLEEVKGKNPRFLKSGETCNAEYKRMWELLKSGQEWKGEFHNKKKNGELYWENATITPIIDGEGRITNYVALK
ncbi:MAG: response regulator, partial [Syntrophothermus sp.]